MTFLTKEALTSARDDTKYLFEGGHMLGRDDLNVICSKYDELSLNSGACLMAEMRSGRFQELKDVVISCKRFPVGTNGKQHNPNRLLYWDPRLGNPSLESARARFILPQDRIVPPS